MTADTSRQNPRQKQRKKEKSVNFSNKLVHIQKKTPIPSVTYYSLIAFDERVTFWLQRVRSLPCACAYVALFAHRLAYNRYAIAHAYNAANTHAQGIEGSEWPGPLKPKSYSLVEGNQSIAQWLDSDGVISVDNYWQHGDWAANGSVVTVLPALNNSDYTVTVQSLCSHCS